MGGDLVFGNVESPFPVNEKGTDMAGATKRVAHVANACRKSARLDCGTMNFSPSDYVMTNTPSMLREMATADDRTRRASGIEAFDTGHLWFASNSPKKA